MKRIFLFVVILSSACSVLAAHRPTTQRTTHPATRPATQSTAQPVETIPVPADSVLGRMLQTSNAAQPLVPEASPPPVDATSGMAAVKPKAPPILLRPEGYYVIGRLGRLGGMNGGFHEMVFDSDGLALHDPPMRILPNQMLASMEDQTRLSANPMAFRISGLITQYMDRNYILIDKAVPAPRQ